MKKIEYEEKINHLFDEWKKARPEYELGENCFTHDGIANFDNYNKSKPKILFLLKENWDRDYDLRSGIDVGRGKDFNLNIARWRQIIRDLYIDRN